MEKTTTNRERLLFFRPPGCFIVRVTVDNRGVFRRGGCMGKRGGWWGNEERVERWKYRERKEHKIEKNMEEEVLVLGLI